MRLAAASQGAVRHRTLRGTCVLDHAAEHVDSLHGQDMEARREDRRIAGTLHPWGQRAAFRDDMRRVAEVVDREHGSFNNKEANMRRMLLLRAYPSVRQRTVRPVRCRAVWALAAITGSLLLLAVPAIAQAPELSTATAATPRETPAPGQLDAGQIANLARAMLVFAIVALLSILGYTFLAQKEFYSTVGKLDRARQAVKAVPVQTFERVQVLTVAETGEAAWLKINGPGVVTVGVQSDAFSADLPDGSSAPTAKWTVAPATAAAIRGAETGSGAQVKVIAATAGAFTLSAEADYPAKGSKEVPKTAAGSVAVAALEPESKAVDLPFVGSGYGALAISVILIAAVVILGITHILSGEGIATLLGGLLGYIFGVGVASNPNRKPAAEE